MLTKQSRIAPRTAVAKPLSSAVAIGTAAPFGAEGPIIVTGGALGSLLGQVVRVSPAERKILLACGAAAGMAATFGAPLASVVLAIELLLFEFSARALVPLVVATSVAGGVHGALFGSGPLFSVPTHDYAGLDVLPAFIVLGLACGLLAVVISKGLFIIEALYRRLPIGEFWHPVVGAIGFAAVGVAVPRSLGVGYDAISDVLDGRLALATVAALALAKLAAWWLALASGTSGGTLAPILLMSAAFGTLAGSGLNAVLPGHDIAPGAFALVAMAATFGAATRATFTAIVFVFELTRDYVDDARRRFVSGGHGAYPIIDPTGAVVGIVTRGDVLGEDTEGRAAVVDHASRDVVAVASSDNAITALHAMIDEGVEHVPVIDDGRLVGICTRTDLLKVREHERDHERHQPGLRVRCNGWPTENGAQDEGETSRRWRRRIQRN